MRHKELKLLGMSNIHRVEINNSNRLLETNGLRTDKNELSKQA